MLNVKYPIIVEGKYDKAFLKSFLDATVLTTEGFSVYKNDQFKELATQISKDKKIIVLTDSDNAGKQIRNYLKNILKDIEIINLYTPQIVGKEKRKEKPSKEGFLGVEGQNKEEIIALLQEFIATENRSNEEKITKTDLYFCGLSGNENASFKRQELLKAMNLPLNISTNMLLEVLNRKYNRGEFKIKFKED